MTDAETLQSLASEIAAAEKHVKQVRAKRDKVFVNLYEKRKMSVTEMAKWAGIGRESVHDAINRQRNQKG